MISIKMTVVIRCILFVLLLSPMILPAQKKSKPKVEKAIGNLKNKLKGTNKGNKEKTTQQNPTSAPEPAPSQVSEEKPPPKHETITIDFRNEELRNFEVIAYKGELLAHKFRGAMGTSSEKLPENHNEYRLLNVYRRYDSASVVVAYGNSRAFLTPEANKKYNPIRLDRATVFEKKKATEAFKAAGIQQALIAAQQKLPSPRDGYYFEKARFSPDYDFEKEAFFMDIRSLRRGRDRFALRYYYKMDPAEAERQLAAMASKDFYILRKAGAPFDQGEIFRDEFFTDKLSAFGPDDLVVVIKDDEVPYIGNDLDEVKFKEVLDRNIKACKENPNRYVDCDCIKKDIQFHIADVLRTTYNPTILVTDQALNEACQNGNDVYVATKFTSIMFLEANDANENTIQYQLKRKPNNISGPFKSCDLIEKLKKGQGTERFYNDELTGDLFSSQMRGYTNCIDWLQIDDRIPAGSFSDF